MHLTILLRLLREDCPDPFVGGINLDHELSQRVWHGEDGGRGEATLEGLEGCLRLWRPVELHLRGGKSMERRSYCAKASDEPPVKVSKSEELLNLFAAIRCGPLSHSANFSRVHLHSSRGYDEAQEGDSVGMEHTLFCFDIESVIQQSFQDFGHVVLVSVKVRGVNEDVVEVHINKKVQEVSKYVVNHGLEYSRCICESKRHDQVFIMATWGIKSCLPLVPLSNSNQMVSVAKV